MAHIILENKSLKSWSLHGIPCHVTWYWICPAVGALFYLSQAIVLMKHQIGISSDINHYLVLYGCGMKVIDGGGT